MPPAARIGDMHTCPMVTGVVPHVGGPILPPGCPTVLIGGRPAANAEDTQGPDTLWLQMLSGRGEGMCRSDTGLCGRAEIPWPVGSRRGQGQWHIAETGGERHV